MPPPQTVFDVVRSHVRLPINRDYGALKQALRDWLAYSTHTPLQEKPIFAADLVVTITRSASTGSSGADRAGVESDTQSGRTRGRRWALWGSRAKSPNDGTLGSRHRQSASSTAGAAASSATTAPRVYRKVVPLRVWTAVLPWEMQRGLSCSDLRLPAPSALEETAEDERSAVDVKREEGAAKGEEEQDLLGVVTPSPAAFPSPPPASPRAAAAAPSGPATSVTAPVPAMLFLSDVPAVRAHGIGFWSGAIRAPIDVVFVAPALPSAVGPRSASFRALRQQEGRAQVEDNAISAGVQQRYFPVQEIQPPMTPSAAAPVEFSVHSFSHLDPLPDSLHPSRLGLDDRKAAYRGLRFTASPDAPYASAEEAPRYVFEVPRHTLQPAVAAALAESRAIFDEVARASTASDQRQTTSDADVAIDLTVRMSSDLRADLFGKAQLCVEYVSLLEEAIAHYTRLLNTDPAATAEVPLGTETAAAGSARGETSGGGDAAPGERPVKVWLSEHEFRWMTPSELQRAAAAGAAAPSDDAAPASVESEEYGASAEPAADAQRHGPDAVTAEDARSADPAAVEASVAAARAVHAQPMQPGAVSAARSISLQSPLLHDEEEGRPSYLAPSFVGRHEAGTLQQSAVVLSADKLARYPRSHSHMPVLPPVDYELYELCLRLGVGQQSILYHYHERIAQEWRRALHARRGGGPLPIAAADVQRMVGLVRDRSLQLPPETVSLVEAVAAPRA